MQIYEVYIDVLAINNFLADLAALFAVSVFFKRKTPARRILAGAVLGTLGSCAAFLCCRHMAVYLLAVHFLVNPLVLLFCFREKTKQEFLADLCGGYFAFLLLGGITEWLYEGENGFLSYKMTVSAAFLLLPAAVLWIRRQLQNRIRYLEAQLCQQGKRLCLTALSDSGNLLRDPYTGKAVSMIDRSVYETAYGAAQAVRLIPYESLGCRHGLLEAVTIEELSYAYGNGTKTIKRAVLGLADHALFEKKPYQMIINPQENPTGGKYEKDG